MKKVSRMIAQESELAEKYDFATEENGKLVILSTDNVAKALAMVRRNSSYKKELDSKSVPKNKYIGSSAYWCSELKPLLQDKECSEKYQNVITKLVKAIDNENSTHLNSDNIGIESVTNRIKAIAPNQLKELLENRNNDYELLHLIAKALKEGEKKHLSFASKFCHFLSFNIFDKEALRDQYVIYDEVIRKALPLYVKKHLGKTVKAGDYEDNYECFITDIREIAKKNGISKNGFDQLVWYFHK